MPRLGSLLICEKIVVDQQNKPTLISVFQTISALVPEGQEVPKDMIAGTPWAIFSEWFFTQDESAKSFDQVLEVLLPDGSPSPIRGRASIKEIAKGGEGTRVYVQIFGMPMAQTGFVAVNVWLESDSNKVTDVFSYPIKIQHTKQSSTPNDGGQIVTAVPALTQVKPQ